MKQTAVEYLLEFCEMANCRIPNDIIEQAKAMEKEQIMDAWNDGRTVGHIVKMHKETFNTNEK